MIDADLTPAKAASAGRFPGRIAPGRNMDVEQPARRQDIRERHTTAFPKRMLFDTEPA